MKLKTLVLLTTVLIVITTPHTSFADEAEGYTPLGPVEGRNQMPLLNLFYVMQSTGTETLGKGKQEIRLAIDISNIYEERASASTVLAYDMEIYRPALHYSYGLTDSLDLHTEIPALAFNGGQMDGAIQDYHDLFGFPNGERDNVQDGQFGYSFSQGGQTIFDFSSTGLNLSDINIDLKWKVWDDHEGRPAAALRAGVKLPTGNYGKGTGSDRLDFALGVLLSKATKRFSFFGGLDLNIINPPAELKQLVTEEIVHTLVGVEFMALKNRLSLILQLEGQNSPFAKTGEKTFDNEILEIIYGIKGVTSKKKLLWQLSMREDLIHDSTVDFTLSFSLGARF